MPDRLLEMKALAESARTFFGQKHAARERALQLSRTVIQLSATAIRSAHRGQAGVKEHLY